MPTVRTTATAAATSPSATSARDIEVECAEAGAGDLGVVSPRVVALGTGRGERLTLRPVLVSAGLGSSGNACQSFWGEGGGRSAATADAAAVAATARTHPTATTPHASRVGGRDVIVAATSVPQSVSCRTLDSFTGADGRVPLAPDSLRR
jgi:hypothetical protein